MSPPERLIEDASVVLSADGTASLVTTEPMAYGRVVSTGPCDYSVIRCTELGDGRFRIDLQADVLYMHDIDGNRL